MGEYPRAFKWAMKEALKSVHHHRVGAVLVAHGKPIAKGHNSIRRHKYSSYYQYPEACHAEAAALSEGRSDSLSASILYVTRLNRSGRMMMARPCASCFSLLRDKGIRKVVYTTGQGYAEETIL